MFYQDFIQCVKRQGSSKVKALAIDESCSTEQVPTEILHVLPALIELLETNPFFNSSDEVMFLFGLQPCVISLHSDFPITHKRILDEKNPFRHLCCVLQYFLTSKVSINKNKDWQQTQTLVIDFTTGLLMNNECYFSKVLSLPSQGLVYAGLQQSELNAVWAMIGKK